MNESKSKTKALAKGSPRKTAPKTSSPAKPKSAVKKPAKSKNDPSPKGRAHRRAPLSSLPTNENGIVMLAGGNPQIPKGDGNAPVQLYIANMPGWKSALGKRLDAIIAKHVPGVQKAVRWNSPFYGAGKGWFVSFHVFTKYVKVTFFAGKSLKPLPPGGTGKSGEALWIDIHEDDFDEALEKRFVAWVKQASRIPGWDGS